MYSWFPCLFSSPFHSNYENVHQNWPRHSQFAHLIKFRLWSTKLEAFHSISCFSLDLLSTAFSLVGHNIPTRQPVGTNLEVIDKF